MPCSAILAMAFHGTLAILLTVVVISTSGKRYASKNTYNNSFTSVEFEAIDSGLFRLQFHPQFCTPVHLSMVLRHGIRTPSPKDIVHVNGLYSRWLETADRDKLLHEGAKNLYGNWDNTFDIESPRTLTTLGAVEVKSIANRFKELFPKLLASPTARVLFMSSHKNRTRGTCEAFNDATCGELPDFQNTLSIRNDIIRFYDGCEKYVKEVEENKEAMQELHLFKQGALYTAVAQRIAAKLNLTDVKAAVLSIYAMAATEEAAFGSSLWSSLMEEEDLHVLQYTKDLKAYWKKSYGHVINYKQSCPLLQDIIQHLDAAVEGKDFQESVVRCGHSETLLPLEALLGLYQDGEPLRADNFHRQHQRQFTTSRIDPFAANLAVVLYECDENAEVPQVDTTFRLEGVRYPEWPQKLEKHMVQLLHNELPVRLPFCDYDLCPYDQLKEHYEDILKKCNNDELCQWMDERHTEL